MKVLVAAGADPNARDKLGKMPIHKTFDVGAVKVLVAVGADPNARDKWGETPLHAAGAERYGLDLRPRDLVEVLVAAGADPNARGKWGDTPLHRATSGAPYADNRTGDVDVVKALIAAGADPNAPNDGGKTPLHTACDDGKSNVRMAWRGIESSLVPEEPQPANIVEILLALGADPNACDESGRTSLQTVRSGGVAEALLAAGADPKALERNPHFVVTRRSQRTGLTTKVRSSEHFWPEFESSTDMIASCPTLAGELARLGEEAVRTNRRMTGGERTRVVHGSGLVGAGVLGFVLAMRWVEVWPDWLWMMILLMIIVGTSVTAGAFKHWWFRRRTQAANKSARD